MIDALGYPQSLLVIGGSSEIGAAIAIKLARHHTRTVVLAGRNRSELEAVAQKVKTAGASTVATVELDVTQLDSHEAAIEAIFTSHPDIDVVLFAAGVLGRTETPAHDREQALAVTTTNYLGLVSLAYPVVAQLQHQGHGTLVVLSSVAAERPRAANFPYGASKAGLDFFFHGMAEALHADRAAIRIVVVRPGFVRTRMTQGMRPQPFATTADAVATDVVAALRSPASTVWSPGILRWVMTIVRYLPRPLFRRIVR